MTAITNSYQRNTSAILAVLLAVALPGAQLHAQLWNAPQSISGSQPNASCQMSNCPTNENGEWYLETSDARGWSRGTATIGGPLRVMSRLEVFNSTAASILMFGRVGYFETLTVTGPVVPATMRFTFELDGTWGPGSSYGVAVVCNTVTVANPGNNCSNNSRDAQGNQNQFAEQFIPRQQNVNVFGAVDIPVFEGVNNLRLSLSAVSRLYRPAGLDPLTPWSGDAFADFENTAYIRGVNFLDLQNNDITNRVQVEWSSGTRYTPFAVPEPSAVMLLVCGGLVLLLTAVRRRKSGGCIA